jgi:hypothetical protein
VEYAEALTVMEYYLVLENVVEKIRSFTIASQRSTWDDFTISILRVLVPDHNARACSIKLNWARKNSALSFLLQSTWTLFLARDATSKPGFMCLNLKMFEIYVQPEPVRDQYYF